MQCSTMSRLIERNFDALRVLKKASPKLRKAILKNSEKELIIALCEIISNVLSGTVKLSGKQRDKLKSHRSSLRKVVDKKTALKDKRRILQKGGFLAALLPPALALLASLIGNAVN
jgi:hypothetical protein